MTQDEAAKRRKFEALIATPLPRVKPKGSVLQLEVSAKAAAEAKARPDKVRVVTSSEADVASFERPRRTELLEVVEVDASGRPKLAMRYDAATGERGIVEFDEGYRRQGGAVSNYNPIDGLRPRGDD